MKLVYMGTPQFAVRPLLALIEAGHAIAGVVTRIDKPAGRGRTLASPPVKTEAEKLGLVVYQPKRVREPEFMETLARLELDAIVVAAYGQILPPAILDLPRYGCINIHASLLPAYRGAAPINWSIVRGDRETGITIMHMDAGMDTGGVLMQERVPIDSDDTAGTLAEKLSALGAKLIVKALPLVEAGALKPAAQDNSRATLAPPLKKEEGLIDWTLPAVDIHNRVRGLSPWPGAYTFLDGSLIKIIKTVIMPGRGEPGVLNAGGGMLNVGTGRDVLGIVTIQPAGKRPMSSTEFLRGHRGIEGKKFETRS